MTIAFASATPVAIGTGTKTTCKTSLISTQPLIRYASQYARVVFRASAEGSKKTDNKKVTLTWLLTKEKVSSKDTCELLIRSGKVRVNGEIVFEPKARVRRSDHILVQGKDLYRAPNNDDVRNLPNSQRDFGCVSEESSSRPSWQIDGGFFSRKAGGRFK